MCPCYNMEIANMDGWGYKDVESKSTEMGTMLNVNDSPVKGKDARGSLSNNIG